MKNYSKILIASLFVSFNLFAQPTPNIQAVDASNPNGRKIQLAILFDASGSMNGLLNQAKSRIWNIVNELSTYSFNGIAPNLEIALYDYGKDSNEPKKNYVRRLTNFTNDLDLISSNLFSITTNGGSEFCGAVIETSCTELNWSRNSNDLKMIYIAGNEPFNQGPIDYRKVIPQALEREIFVNTIYCGPYQQGIKEFWYEGASLGGGAYFNIDSDQRIKQVPTPYDEQINVYNDSLNKTYVGYGSQAAVRKSAQLAEDANAASLSEENKTERVIAKSKSVYKNESWDLVDGNQTGKMKISEINDSELPSDFKGLTDEEKEEK
ncbi:MAG: VWA domain-containing protein, partial [Bacteroidetes bacterium]|nr:VWA domain-containing protein [Bacteroidota bacterium]